MTVSVIGEKTGLVRDAFLAMGHAATSYDLHDTDIPGPHVIVQDDYDLKDILCNQYHDFVISFLPCTRLANSGVWYVVHNNLYHEVEAAAALFNMPLKCPAQKIVCENPIQHKYARQFIRKYDQTIQPYNFGEDASKRTCLWLKGVPPLQNTSYFPPRIVNGKKRWGNQTDGGWNKLPPTADRAEIRSKTYPGIAKAMANQWG